MRQNPQDEKSILLPKTKSIFLDLEPNQVKLLIVIDNGTTSKRIVFEKSWNILQCLKVIADQTKRLISNPEAYGLCLPTPDEEQKIRKENLKRKLKVGEFRDDTKWLDENHTIEYYKLKNEDVLLYKIKNSLLSQQQKIRIAVYEDNTVKYVEFSYSYMTKVSDALSKIAQDKVPLEEMREWFLFYPVGKKQNGEVFGLTMNHQRTLQSYALHKNPMKKDVVVICLKERAELKKFKKMAIVEDEEEVWWTQQLIKNKWHKFKKKENKANFEKLLLKVRKGIPPALRGDVWPILSGSRTFYEEGKYLSLLGTPIDPVTEQTIIRDLNRTLPYHPFFQKEEGMRQLKNVLWALVAKNPTIGYCQGMNFIAGILLLTMDEEYSFWTLETMMKQYQMKGFFGTKVILLFNSLKQFSKFVQLQLPDLDQFLKDNFIEISTFATPWFHTIFSHDSQLEFVQRLWDVFFNEGYSIIFRVALAIMKEAKDLVMQLEMNEVVEYFKMTPKQIVDPEMILQAAYKIPKTFLIAKVYNGVEAKQVFGPDASKYLRQQKEEHVGGLYREDKKGKDVEATPTSGEESSVVIINGWETRSEDVGSPTKSPSFLKSHSEHKLKSPILSRQQVPTNNHKEPSPSPSPSPLSKQPIKEDE